MVAAPSLAAETHRISNSINSLKIRFFYNIFMLSVGVNAIVAIYVAIVMPYFLKIKEDVETYNPRVIYIASISGFISFFS